MCAGSFKSELSFMLLMLKCNNTIKHFRSYQQKQHCMLITFEPSSKTTYICIKYNLYNLRFRVLCGDGYSTSAALLIKPSLMLSCTACYGRKQVNLLTEWIKIDNIITFLACFFNIFADYHFEENYGDFQYSLK